jgi:hypothetical protein
MEIKKSGREVTATADRCPERRKRGPLLAMKLPIALEQFRELRVRIHTNPTRQRGIPSLARRVSMGTATQIEELL